jgi:hypothetical protein
MPGLARLAPAIGFAGHQGMGVHRVSCVRSSPGRLTCPVVRAVP